MNAGRSNSEKTLRRCHHCMDMEGLRGECIGSLHSSSNANDQSKCHLISLELIMKSIVSSFKASVRAMDATQQFADKIGIAAPKKFFIAGASKVRRSTSALSSLIPFLSRSLQRGWTSEYTSTSGSKGTVLITRTCSLDNGGCRQRTCDRSTSNRHGHAQAQSSKSSSGIRHCSLPLDLRSHVEPPPPLPSESHSIAIDLERSLFDDAVTEWMDIRLQ